MSKLLSTILSVSILALTSTNLYATSNTEHYVFHYESGAVYDVTITDNTFTWKGLEGDDRGKSETDPIKRKTLSNDVEVIQWKEDSGLFVTLVFDRTHLSIVSSGKTSEGDWLMSGMASIN